MSPDTAAEPASADSAQTVNEVGTENSEARPTIFSFPTGGGAPRINVTVPVTALLEPGREPPGSGEAPAGGTVGEALPSPENVPELHGYGAIDPITARALSAGGIWRRLVTDPETGTVLDVGRKVYRPPADLARLVRARDGTCTRPGCTVKAQACELDHVQSWEHGGPTSAANMVALCPSDHRAKSRGDFTVVRHADGAVDWTSPTGHTYRRAPGGTVVHLDRHDGQADASVPADPPY